MIREFKNLVELVSFFDTDEKCLEYFKSIHWKNGSFCPHCKSKKVYEYKNGKLYKCGLCRKQFSLTVGTIFHGSRVALRKWFIAIYLQTSHKKGISSCQLARDIGVTQKTAWYMLHRIRCVFSSQPTKKLQGVVEMDETYVGGKEKNKHKNKKLENCSGSVGKISVIGMKQRMGNLVLKPVIKADAWRIRQTFETNIEPNAQLYTDESPLYRQYKSRKTVNHSKGNYTKGKVHTNTIEGVFSHFKRMIIGVYHHVSEKHIAKYANMFSFRFNTIELTEGERFNDFINRINVRLPYKILIG